MNEDLFHLGIKALIRDQEGRILLLKVNKETLRGYDGKPYWDIPGGRIHKKDTVEKTLKREVEEETGIVNIKSFEPFFMVLSNLRIPLKDGSDVGLILSVYNCEVEGVDKIVLSEEHVDAQWFGPKEAANLLKFKYPPEFTDRVASL